MPLPPLKQRAVGLLSMGMDVSTVADQLQISRMTLCRWKRDKAFADALDRSTGEMMTNMHLQVQNTARVMVEGALEASNELRHIILNQRSKDHDRRLAAAQVLKHVQRFWDMLGYNAKLTSPRKLLNEELEKYDGAESIDKLPPSPKRKRPRKDRLKRPISEIDPPEAGRRGGALPDEFYDWGDNPIHEDGTPKNPPQPGPEPEPQPEPKPEPVAAPPAVKALAAKQAKPRAARYKRRAKRKAWKRSRTTLRAAAPARAVRSASPVVPIVTRASRPESPREAPRAVCSSGGSPEEKSERVT